VGITLGAYDNEPITQPLRITTHPIRSAAAKAPKAKGGCRLPRTIQMGALSGSDSPQFRTSLRPYPGGEGVKPFHGLHCGSPVGDPALHPWLQPCAPLGRKPTSPP
jgi:hypothetical protein